MATSRGGGLRQLNRSIRERCIKRTNEIVVGSTYFLSSFYEREGAMVKVLGKSTKVNGAGWPSTVEYEVVEVVGPMVTGAFYSVGKVGACNASNLYEHREDAAHGTKNKS